MVVVEGYSLPEMTIPTQSRQDYGLDACAVI
jgi:hypothetical protein